MKLLPERKHIPVIVLILFGVLLFFMGIANHYYFRTVTFDYGNYNFAFRDYAHFRLSPMPTYPGNFLQDHFSFTLLYFIPVFWLLNWLTGTYTLIIIQYSLILVAAWYTYKLIKIKSDNIWLGTGVLVYYFVLLGRYTTFSCDVNLAVLSSCFIPVFIYYFQQRKFIIATFLLILSLLSRENIPIWFIFIFLVLLIQNRQDKMAVAFSLIGIFVSMAYFALLFKVLIPAIETEEKQFTLFNYSALGETPGDALKYVIRHPVETVRLFFVNHLEDPAYNGVKTEFYLVYLVSGGIILLLRPQYLLWFIPIVAQKVLNDSYIRWGISTYYSIEVVTLLPLSVVLTLAALKNRIVQSILMVLVCMATLAMTIYKLDPKNVRIPWTLNPAKERIYKKQFFLADFHIKEVNQIMKKIPENARVSASDHLFPHLSQRNSIYLFPDVNDAEYIIFSVFDNYFMYSHMENEKRRIEYLESPEWEILASEFPVFLLKNKLTANGGNAKNRIAQHLRDTILCNYELTDSLKNLVIFDDSTFSDQYGKLTSGFARSGRRSLKLDPQNPFGSSVNLADAEKLEYIRTVVWYKGNDRANIVASCGSDFYLLNGTPSDQDEQNWKKLELDFWVPRNPDVKNLTIYLWNTGSDPVCFDDFQIIKRYMTH